jgi:hypothetical protein
MAHKWCMAHLAADALGLLGLFLVVASCQGAGCYYNERMCIYMERGAARGAILKPLGSAQCVGVLASEKAARCCCCCYCCWLSFGAISYLAIHSHADVRAQFVPAPPPGKIAVCLSTTAGGALSVEALPGKTFWKAAGGYPSKERDYRKKRRRNGNKRYSVQVLIVLFCDFSWQVAIGWQVNKIPAVVLIPRLGTVGSIVR